MGETTVGASEVDAHAEARAAAMARAQAEESAVEDVTRHASALLDRIRWMNQAGLTFRGARDLYQILGYIRQLTTWDYQGRYERGGLAGRVVDVMPDATWRGSPAFQVVEDKSGKADTPFEAAWEALATRLNLGALFPRADKLSRLSTFAVILIGVAGDEPLEQEMPRGGGNARAVIYAQAYLGGGGPGGDARSRALATNSDASVYEFETDARSPRFGRPRSYWLKRTDVSSPALQRPVHWSRVVHVAEGLLQDEVYGQPALERVWNLLDDLEKVTGGGAEAFWLRANQGLHVNVQKEMALPQVSAAVEALKSQSEEYKHQLTRWLRTYGTDVETLGSDVADFSRPADAIITQIAGSKAIPKRILTGSEMGELASSQDRENFKDQVNGRRDQHAGPNIVRQFVDRLLDYGHLPPPAALAVPEAETPAGMGPIYLYHVTWPNIQALTEQERAEGAAKWASVNASMGETVFSSAEIRDHWYGMEEKDSDSDTMLSRATLAWRMAQANQVMGEVVFTNAEIRDTAFGWGELTPEERGQVAPGTVPAVGPDGMPLADPGTAANVVQMAPAARAATVRALRAAMARGDAEEIAAIAGVPAGGDR
jgi:hypothetical protein